MKKFSRPVAFLGAHGIGITILGGLAVPHWTNLLTLAGITLLVMAAGLWGLGKTEKEGST